LKYVWYIQINIAYPSVKNDDDVCEVFESLTCKVKHEILFEQKNFGMIKKWDEIIEFNLNFYSFTIPNALFGMHYLNR
jgi:hypothetical protein